MRARNATQKRKHTKRHARRAGYVSHGADYKYAVLMMCGVMKHVVQVEYFNKRRVIADAQKEILAKAERQRLEAEANGFKRDR